MNDFGRKSIWSVLAYTNNCFNRLTHTSHCGRIINFLICCLNSFVLSLKWTKVLWQNVWEGLFSFNYFTRRNCISLVWFLLLSPVKRTEKGVISIQFSQRAGYRVGISRYIRSVLLMRDFTTLQGWFGRVHSKNPHDLNKQWVLAGEDKGRPSIVKRILHFEFDYWMELKMFTFRNSRRQ